MGPVKCLAKINTSSNPKITSTVQLLLNAAKLQAHACGLRVIAADLSTTWLRVQLYFGQFFSVSFLTASKNWWKYAHLSGFLAASKNWWKYAHPYSFLAASKNCPKWLLHGRRGGFFSSIYWKIKAFKHEWGVGSPYMPPTKPIGCSETIWSWIQYIWYECKRLHFGSS